MKRGTPDHPKVHELADILGITWIHALGVLEYLWHLTARFAPQGNIGKWDDLAIAELFREPKWKRNPAKLIGALIQTGWLDRDPDYRLIVHDWDQHADQSVRKTLKAAGKDFIKPTREHRVYFIRSVNSKTIKIGVTSTQANSRFLDLQRNSMEKLELLGEVSGGYSLEQSLHERFSSQRKQGEWFEESNELLNVINELCSLVPEKVGHVVGSGTTHRARVALPVPVPVPVPVVTRPSPIPIQNTDERPDYAAAAGRMCAVHNPDRAVQTEVEKALVDVVSPEHDRTAVLAKIEACHGWKLASDDWSKERGRFQKRLDKWVRSGEWRSWAPPQPERPAEMTEDERANLARQIDELQNGDESDRAFAAKIRGAAMAPARGMSP